MDGMQAIDALLHFVQKAFLYQTDEEQFGAGVEKAIFRRRDSLLPLL